MQGLWQWFSTRSLAAKIALVLVVLALAAFQQCSGGGKGRKLTSTLHWRYPRCENSGSGNAKAFIQDRASLFAGATWCVLLIPNIRGHRSSQKSFSPNHSRSCKRTSENSPSRQ